MGGEDPAKDVRRLGFASRAVHGAQARVPAETPISTPIYETSTFAFEDAEQYARALDRPETGFAYTRYANPTIDALEATLADLEHGTAAVATASGMAAISAVLWSTVVPGDHAIAQADLNGGSYSLLTAAAGRLGIEVTFVDVAGMIRVSVGLEDAGDLLADFDQALTR
jgi:methionine-gamma-lyase